MVEDDELENVKKSCNDRSSHDALAGSLDGTAYYAANHRKRLKALPRFDHKLIDEALVVAHRLREQSAVKNLRGPWRGRSAIRSQRARVTRLLHDRMNVARRTIRYAFPDHPDVVQRATSQYRRERRQKQRQKQRSKKQSG
jgi:hypothetical protein